MINYSPLWETMKRKGATTYTLRNKGKPYNVSGATIEHIKRGKAISTNTLDAICAILDCAVSDVIEYIPDENQKRGL